VALDAMIEPPHQHVRLCTSISWTSRHGHQNGSCSGDARTIPVLFPIHTPAQKRPCGRQAATVDGRRRREETRSGWRISRLQRPPPLWSGGLPEGSSSEGWSLGCWESRLGRLAL